jgi:hypothetical protein
LDLELGIWHGQRQTLPAGPLAHTRHRKSSTASRGATDKNDQRSSLR